MTARSFALLGMTALAALPALAEETPLPTDYLRIEWIDAAAVPDENADGGENEAAFRLLRSRLTCGRVADLLLERQGPWGLGVFADFGCYRDGSLIAGHKTTNPVFWQLSVKLKDDAWDLELTFLPPKGTAQKLKLPVSSAANYLISDTALQMLLAASVLDSLPMAVSFIPNRPSLPKKAPKIPAGLAALAPTTLTLFSLNYDESAATWATAPFGVAKRVSKPAGGAKPPRTWEVKLSAPHVKTEPFYAQRAEGPGTQTAAILKAMTKRLAHLRKKPAGDDSEEGSEWSLKEFGADAGEFLSLMTVRNVANGYLGLRFGRELVDPDTAVLPPANLFGLLAEMRSGPLQGLRIYYDVVPRSSTDANGEEIYLGWSRLVVGWGFGYAPPCPEQVLTCRLELAPKAGMWSVEAQLPMQGEDGRIESVKLETRRAFSLGYELSAELGRRQGFARLWFANDRSLAALIGDRLGDPVTSSRYGLDAFFKGPSFSLFGGENRLGFLLFVFEDQLKLAGLKSESSDDAVTLGIKTLYGGGGISVSW